MADRKMTTAEFGALVKAKHPEYAKYDDQTIGLRVLAVYPEYSGKVQMGATDPTVAGTNAAGQKVFGSDEGKGPSYAERLFNPVGSGAAEQGIFGGTRQIGGQALKTMITPWAHPIDTAAALAKTGAYLGGQRMGVAMPEEWNPVTPMVQSFMGDKEKGGLPLALENLGGQALGTYEGGRMANVLGNRVLAAGSAARTAAIGDPDAAALRGLGVGSASKKALSTLGSVEGARPYLKGVSSLEDLQTRVPLAKSEIWGPYQKTVDAIGDKSVMGPDGPTTVGQLEGERLKISANLRTLKSNSPEAMQLAQQKGMSQAELLQREKAVQAALDPHLEAAGVDAKAVRKTFGNVAQVGERVSGKSTLAEKPQPYGLGRIANISLEHPFQAPQQVMGGVRDLVAGRPWFSGSPTDVNIREAFRLGGEKPDFRAPIASMPRVQMAPLKLESDVPGNAGYGEDYTEGPTPLVKAMVGQAPPLQRALMSEASPGQTQPMVSVLKHPGAQRSYQPETTMIAPPQFLSPEQPLPMARTISPTGEIRLLPRAMLPGKTGNY